ncbi:NADP-dependent oxidoreductase [Baekduia soli]|uniref:NADP-dependent oxidoreductase n=1 Tax=Baekduia soli TaxID=496014 RepID=A0A5B8U3V1_9ACTN|nr:NADP-dependent oxidoreductase [Baekduia soli]QEC47568.1 NADP-dependent oxidoreductase [Baekduia soli]
MPRVVVATAYGGPEVLQVVDEAPGAPGPGEVLLAVRAAGVNPVDRRIFGGGFGADPADLPLRLGFEASGVVLEAGPGAQGPLGPVAAGDEVVAFRIAGGYAEQVVVGAAACIPKPPALGWEAAGGLLLAGVTAWHTLAVAEPAAGETLLVHAASGAVGRCAVQLAVARGTRVIGTASPSRHDDLRALGAEPVAYGEGLQERVRALAPGGVDAAIDCAGTDEAIDTSLALVADRGRIVTIAAFARGAREGIRLLGGGPGADPGTAIREAARPELVRLAAEGRLVLPVQAFPLAGAAEAHRAAVAGHAGAKLVLVP